MDESYTNATAFENLIYIMTSMCGAIYSFDPTSWEYKYWEAAFRGKWFISTRQFIAWFDDEDQAFVLD